LQEVPEDEHGEQRNGNAPSREKFRKAWWRECQEGGPFTFGHQDEREHQARQAAWTSRLEKFPMPTTSRDSPPTSFALRSPRSDEHAIPLRSNALSIDAVDDLVRDALTVTG